MRHKRRRLHPVAIIVSIKFHSHNNADLIVGRKFIYNLLTFLLTLTLIMGVSIFTYGTFYFAYMPTEVRLMT